MNSVLDRIYDKIEEKYNKGELPTYEGNPEITYDLIRNICRSQFGLLRDIIKEDKGYSLRLQYLGIFGITTRRTKFIEKVKEEFNGYLPTQSELNRIRKEQKDNIL